MPTIELWEKTGTGFFKTLHNLHRPIEVIALENADGDLFPIYMGHNNVPVGSYDIVSINPYAKEDSDVFTRPAAPTICVYDDDDLVCIVRETGLTGGYWPQKNEEWDKYYDKNKDKLDWAFGWLPQTAERMILEANRRFR